MLNLLYTENKSNIENIKEYMIGVIEELHHKQIKSNKRIIVIKQDKSLFFCHLKIQDGSVHDNEVHYGKRIDEDNIISCFIITNSEKNRKIDVKYYTKSNAKSIKRLFLNDYISNYKSKDIYINGRYNSEHIDYDVKLTFDSDDYTDYYNNDIIKFNNKESIVKIYEDKYEFYNGSYKGKDIDKIIKLIRETQKDICYRIQNAYRYTHTLY